MSFRNAANICAKRVGDYIVVIPSDDDGKQKNQVRNCESQKMHVQLLLSISSTLNGQILRTEVLFGSFFYVHVTANKTFVRKTRA